MHELRAKPYLSNVETARLKMLDAEAAKRGLAKDGFEQVTDPIAHLRNGQQREVAGDRSRALDSYRAAAAGFRLTNDVKNLTSALDGLAACQSPASLRYDHPGRGRTRVCDSADSALRTALERTRAGERVSICDGLTVKPGRAKDGFPEPHKPHKFTPTSGHLGWPAQPDRCEACGKSKEDGPHEVPAKDATTPEGRGLRDRIREIKAQISGGAGIDLKRSDPARYAALEKELTEWLDQASDVLPVGDDLMSQREEESLNKSLRKSKGGVEAYGVKGMKNSSWRKAFKSVEAMNKWVDQNDAEVQGTRDIE
jgi:hypothetical protein